jgi:hypothetical protein
MERKTSHSLAAAVPRRPRALDAVRVYQMKRNTYFNTVDSLLTHSPHNPYSLKSHRNMDFPSWLAGVMG